MGPIAGEAVLQSDVAGGHQERVAVVARPTFSC